MLSLVLLCVAAGVVLFLVLRPGAGQLPEGPLGSRPENTGFQGDPARLGKPDTVGVDSLYNGGNVPAVIDRLILVSPRHIKLVGAYITIGGSLVGNWETFPPPTRALYRSEPGVHWAGRHRPAGTIVPGHQWALVALGLEPTAATGHIASIDIFYHVGTTRYEWHGHVAIGLTVEPKPTGSPAAKPQPTARELWVRWNGHQLSAVLVAANPADAPPSDSSMLRVRGISR
ncbi:MAG: hypothetical protein ACLP7J_10960 [Streptosporangiaceae bacterium]